MQIVIDIPTVTYAQIQKYGLSLNPRDKANLEEALNKAILIPPYLKVQNTPINID